MSRALTWLLCGMTGAFLLQFGAEVAPFQSQGNLTDLLVLSRDNLAAGRVWIFLTHGVLHDTTNILHVVVSLAGIFLLGRRLEPTYGTRTLLALFGASILVGGLVWLTVTHKDGASLVGATAGVYGLLAFYTLAEPQQEWRILVFFALPLKIRLRHLVAALAAVDLLGLLLVDLLQRPWPFEYAPAAHLGGLATGWACFRFLPRLLGTNQGDDLDADACTGPASMPAAGSFPAPRANAATGDNRPASATIRQQVDRILDKINREGLTALTEEERRTLDNARDLLNRR